jgi:hypothetical protein
VEKILEPLLNYMAILFMDNIRVKGPYIDYNNKEVLPRIQRFIYEYIQNLDKILEQIERAGISIRPKSQFIKKGIMIVGFSTSSFGHLPKVTKVIKIISWPSYTCISDMRAFISICVFYWIWVYYLALITEPIYRLIKKGVV